VPEVKEWETLMFDRIDPNLCPKETDGLIDQLEDDKSYCRYRYDTTRLCPRVIHHAAQNQTSTHVPLCNRPFYALT
jgi:hypothetical protein